MGLLYFTHQICLLLHTMTQLRTCQRLLECIALIVLPVDGFHWRRGIHLPCEQVVEYSGSTRYRSVWLSGWHWYTNLEITYESQALREGALVPESSLGISLVHPPTV
jgi:hypothetical protein